MRIEGRNPVREALRAGVRIKRLLIAEGAGERGALEEIVAAAAAARIRVERVPRHRLDEHAETPAHQGVIAETGEFAYTPWQHAVERVRLAERTPLLLALDGITDPQNAGSLIRTAHLMGADAVLLPARRAAPVTATVAKASAGAIWHTPVDQVTNLERALAECKKDGLWVAGVDADGETEISSSPLLAEPLVLVIGSEGRGLSRLVRERADVLVKISQTGQIDSLGAAVAGGIALYAAHLARAVSAAGTDLSHSAGERDLR